MFKAMPISLWWFVATAIIFLLQAFPLTGVFLMLVAAPVWSVLTVNAGFVSLAAEAIVRPGYRLWLLAPALYIGGYLVAAGISHAELETWDKELHAANAGVSVPYTPDAHALVLRPDRSGEATSIKHGLVRTYGVPVVYEVNTNVKTASHSSQRLIAAAQCQQIKEDPSARAANVEVAWVRTGRKQSKDLCVLNRPEDPDKPAITITISGSKQSRMLVDATIEEATIEMPGGATSKLLTGRAAPLPWIPKPMMGCALNSSAPSWNCYAGFLRSKARQLGGSSLEVVATSLGLEAQTLADLTARLPARTAADIEADVARTIQQNTALSLQNLDRIIADPSVQLTVHDIRGLKEQPELWRNRVPDMLDALERAMTGQRSMRERAGMLQGLFAVLDDDDYRPVAERTLAILSAHPEISRDVVRDTALERLAIVGEAALPVLDQRIFWSNRRPGSGYREGTLRYVVSKGAILGLCKLGRNAEHLAGRIAAPFLSREGPRDRDARFAAVVTLLRLGRADLAEAAGKVQPDQSLDAIRSRVGPDSPADVCVNRSAWRSRLASERRRADRAD
ncbi:MAG: hypothetical protein KDJ37_08995 [Hyphomicrobiaceae bacterium]|nr:hypothetical protein [Hyphomicrobiaceae bacterium]